MNYHSKPPARPGDQPLCYFHWVKSGTRRTRGHWLIETEDDVLLGGPFPNYWAARAWAIEKEFVDLTDSDVLFEAYEFD